MKRHLPFDNSPFKTDALVAFTTYTTPVYTVLHYAIGSNVFFIFVFRNKKKQLIEINTNTYLLLN